MKIKRILFAVIFATTVGTAFSFEIGGLVNAGVDAIIPVSGVNEQPVTLKNSERLSLWLKQNMDKEGNFNFGVQSSYWLFINANFIKAPEKTTKTTVTNIVDLDYLNFSFFFPMNAKSSVDFNFGRYGISDSSGLILNQNIDGASLVYNIPAMKFRFDFGYTGFLNTHTNPLNFEPMKVYNSVYSPAAAFLMVKTDADFNIGKYDHNIGLHFLSFAQPKKDTNYQLFYFMDASGSIIPKLFFDIAGGVTTRKVFDKNGFGGFAKLGLNYYFDKFNAVLGFRSIYTSGGKNSFVGFSKINISKVTSVFLGNMLTVGANTSLKPVNGLTVGFDTNAFFKTEYSVDNPIKFDGFEWSGNIGYSIDDDIYMSFNLGQFIKSKSVSHLKMGLKFVVSF